MNEWIKCICNEILFSHKKEANSAIWNNKNGPWGLYAKWSYAKLEKDSHCISTLSCRIWKKTNSWEQKVDWWLPESGWKKGRVIVGKGSQKVQTSHNKINKLWGYNIQHGDYS